ncbi:amidase [Aquidulcibacter paucihalophilus]|uniref:amidase n=1 Tax=Aquidulcibacter paucihalophilus TaxID=1978549 RepID=UPI000A195646|nr:amidase [Aquidulcibacter paucihalophilus]
MDHAKLLAANQAIRAFIAFDETPPQSEGALAGLRLGVKGNIAVQGLANTAGSQARRQAIATHDAPVVALLRKAGAEIVGTLNMHEGALGATTDNKAYGRCINPWRANFSPGGSSGGSGAAIAAGLVDAALGTDTMGSIRLPASYCGVYGWKPSGTLVSQSGVVPLSTTLDQVGPLAKNPETLWAVAKALGAPAALHSLQGLRFAVARDRAAPPALIQPSFAVACQRLLDAGAQVIEVDLALGFTDIDVVLACLLVCEVEGAREWAAELADPDSGLTPEFRAMLSYGQGALQARIDQAYETIALTKERLRNCFSREDLAGVISPTVSHLAFDHDVGPPVDQAYATMYANVGDLPAISAPMGLIDGLPIGFHAMTAPGREDIALGLAGLFPAMTLPVWQD